MANIPQGRKPKQTERGRWGRQRERVSMTPSYQRIGNQHFLYDSGILENIAPEDFEPDALREAGKIQGEAQGRGSVYFISSERHRFVLRHYKRGGLISKLITDHYFWTGLTRTRPWREWHLLRMMYENGLPVPRPVAARVVKSGWTYTADLLTMTLTDCVSLAECIKEKALTKEILLKTGKVIRDFHEHHIYHADLNAHNILINNTGCVYLIDFDQGARKTGENWKEANLARLHRSLTKLDREAGGGNFSKENWRDLVSGYIKIVV
ncbi:MAG: 3-deoxy-D-manno-octulosonic acid kinase [Nitrospiria bacterium]